VNELILEYITKPMSFESDSTEAPSFPSTELRSKLYAYTDEPSREHVEEIDAV
jgi:hypothetical protein